MMYLPSAFFLLISTSRPVSCSRPICSDSVTTSAPQGNGQQISFDQGSNYDMIAEIKNARIGIENLCCYECGTKTCCCNFEPGKEECNGKGCTPPPEPTKKLVV
ncbi:hypothetical protein BU16DRAFT_532059 [Lophium mytilinum]|uniref:Uncharacterized protein n=1 Tax=Lophium mytilinum TaxID=390894 RepID=A0A6A6Q9D1_9PEZI|nr:hypothetical protein BU16DRAFT_532059 [Lophium mytilinum]